MSVASDYKRQFAWRGWATALDALPLDRGQVVLDLGCGVGDLSAELVARGARVIGVDMNEGLLSEAQSRGMENAEFRLLDLSRLPDLGVAADGLWSSLTAAYFPDLSSALASWTKHVRPGGWVALTEVDDLFGHEPLSARTKSLFDGYVRDALLAGRYDFNMGRKLRHHFEQSGLTVSKTLTLADKEFTFEGPARDDVLDGWRVRLDRMRLLQDFCGADFGHLRDEFLSCLRRPDHRSAAKVHCCIGIREG